MENKLRKLFAQLGATILSLRITHHGSRVLVYVQYQIPGAKVPLSHDQLGTEQQVLSRFRTSLENFSRITN